MNKAFRILAYSERTETPVTLIAIHKAMYFADKDNGTLSMGPGGFVEALEYASGIKAHVVGKVKSHIFFAHNDFDLLDLDDFVSSR